MTLARFRRSVLDMPHEQDAGTVAGERHTPATGNGQRRENLRLSAYKLSQNSYLYEVEPGRLSKRFVGKGFVATNLQTQKSYTTFSLTQRVSRVVGCSADLANCRVLFNIIGFRQSKRCDCANRLPQCLRAAC